MVNVDWEFVVLVDAYEVHYFAAFVESATVEGVNWVAGVGVNA